MGNCASRSRQAIHGSTHIRRGKVFEAVRTARWWDVEEPHAVVTDAPGRRYPEPCGVNVADVIAGTAYCCADRTALIGDTRLRGGVGLTSRRNDDRSRYKQHACRYREPPSSRV